MFKAKSVWPRGAFSFGLDVPKLRLDYQGIVVLQGPNGSGKSSTMNCVAHALCGQNDTPADADLIENLVLRQGCDVQVEFEAQNEPWTVEYVRNFKREGSNAKVSDVFLWNALGEDKRGENLKATQATVRGLIGMDFDQLMATSYMGVNETSKFLQGTDGERMEIITPFLGLSVWDKAQEKVRELKKAAQEQLTAARARLESTQALLTSTHEQVLSPEGRSDLQDRVYSDEQAIKDLESEINRIQASTTSVDNRIRVLESDKVRLQRDQTTQQTARTREVSEETRQVNLLNRSSPEQDFSLRESLSQSISEVRTRYVASRATLESEATLYAKGDFRWELFPEVAALQEKAKALRERQIEVATRKSMLASSIKALPDEGVGECPTCFTSVDAEHLASTKMRFQEEQVALELEAAELERSLQSWMEGAKEQFQGFLAAARKESDDKLDALHGEENGETTPFQGQYDAEVARLSGEVTSWRSDETAKIKAKIKGVLDKIDAALADIKKNIAATEKEIASITQDPATVANRTRVQELQGSIATLRKGIEGLQATLTTSDLHATQVEQLLADIHTETQSADAWALRLDDLTKLDIHCGDKGIKRYKLRSKLGYMNKKIADYMQLMNLPIQMWMQDRVLKKAAQKKKPENLTDEDYSDQFEVFVADGPKIGVPVGQYSAGESTLLSLALLGVLWEVGGQSNLLMIDEPFGYLLEGNRDRALALLEYWGTLGRAVLVADNTGAIDSISRRAATWVFSKEEHISSIQVIE